MITSVFKNMSEKPEKSQTFKLKHEYRYLGYKRVHLAALIINCVSHKESNTFCFKYLIHSEVEDSFSLIMFFKYLKSRRPHVAFKMFVKDFVSILLVLLQKKTVHALETSISDISSYKHLACALNIKII